MDSAAERTDKRQAHINSDIDKSEKRLKKAFSFLRLKTIPKIMILGIDTFPKTPF